MWNTISRQYRNLAVTFNYQVIFRSSSFRNQVGWKIGKQYLYIEYFQLNAGKILIQLFDRIFQFTGAGFGSLRLSSFTVAHQEADFFGYFIQFCLALVGLVLYFVFLT